MRIPHGLRAALAGQGAAPAPSSDANFENVSLLLHGDGTNGAQNNTFVDGSTNNFTITRTGNTTQGTFSPFSPTGWSGYFQDAVADYLTTPSSAQFNMGTGDWTVEGWFYTNKADAGINVTWHVGAINASDGMSGGVARNVVSFRSNGTVDITGAVSIGNQWAHVAWVKVGSSNTVTIYVNGVSVVSGTYSNSIATGTFTCGFNNTSFRYGGYISNLRVLKGTALYTSNFTPPTSPLTAITNTSLLTLQDNRFKDNSTNNFAITRFGDTKIEAFSPFNPTAAYSASTHGGSGYFDGTGDYLTTATDASAFNFGTGNFTIECWVNSTQTTRTDLVNWNYSYSSAGWGTLVCNLTGSGTIAWFEGSGTSLISATSTGWNDGSWHHIAVARSGTSVKMFLDGVQIGSTATSSYSYGAANSGLIVGALTGGSYSLNGYISNLRVLKGTALYTSAFTPPTAPLTAITNTSLLLNFTNGGIIDNASKNVLETVGNAQISTSVKKFGTGSLAFDGNGDYLLAPTSEQLNLGSGNWTIEMWVNASASGYSGLVSWRNASVSSLEPDLYVWNTGVLVWYANTTALITGTTNIVGAGWVHVAVCKSGSSTKLFVNGTQEGSTYTDNNTYLKPNTTLKVGAVTSASQFFNGYIDDLRITKGVARYTANFTPPTAAFPDL